jgi:AcrR family transcriptional regulator
MRPRSFSDEELFAAARTCFLEHGPAVPTSVIAKKLRVSQAALFKRVKSKEALLVGALTTAAVPSLLAELRGGPTRADVREQLLAIASQADRLLSELGPALGVIRSQGSRRAALILARFEPPTLQVHHLLTAWFRALQSQGRATVPDPTGMALLFMSAIESRHTMRHAAGLAYPKGDDRYLGLVVDVVIASICPTAKRRKP